MKGYSRNVRKNRVFNRDANPFFILIGITVVLTVIIKIFDHPVQSSSNDNVVETVAYHEWSADHYDEVDRQIKANENFKTMNQTVKSDVLDAVSHEDRPELYMVTISGETSGASELSAFTLNDSGNAYGIFSLDYRFELVDGMNYLYNRNRKLWRGFEPYLNCRDGSSVLRNNSVITNVFIQAMREDYQSAIYDQLHYMYTVHYKDIKDALKEKGVNLDSRDVAVSAAIMSISVNCGLSAKKEIVKYLCNSMTDEEMIEELYRVRNEVLSQYKVGDRKKGTNKRYQYAEKKMVLDILNKRIDADSTDLDYGNGVEWSGNIFESPVGNWL